MNKNSGAADAMKRVILFSKCGQVMATYGRVGEALVRTPFWHTAIELTEDDNLNVVSVKLLPPTTTAHKPAASQ
jgi:hypothetical protein